ncbi:MULTISPECIES: outer membrane lipoprotein-sorting protein [Pasteurellaceae]|uniref:Outer membrane lipoprotein-sorting protein n=1 Tax=Pasteurella atlantica TaxID=2827233 RepID=A0AAW8CNZ2_9PAST|nr:outer membrane lipoprotein-sorting protein [Pasteurella atlantica]MBR0573212.1 outer membrane lipoprotein-sorting protein [Pasteurella atlantica]MDP8039172.1 outer membrane lipoprotein-sorting protein [Pasteurella atlantica]MDP8041229.1 outer membrane lipoprotein-sorting protein [Pasteurella atlantica]MDP8043366.1 outer membrane lipoprotein-sorting protein [Pasteurella atlantica]MDP8045452.1 outer membrane lipoprotein-sorting protein [Pasteurella atlantica]
MKTNMVKKTALVITGLTMSLSTWAISANEIIHKSNLAAVYPANDGKTEARMMIVDNQGRKQMRQFYILRRNVTKGGDQKYFVVFTKPSDVARTTFLVDKHPGKEDDRWLYLPALDLVKRIAAGDKRTSFVGSTFFYEDISGRDVNADSYSIEKETDKQWILKAVPKSRTGVEFNYFTVAIDKDTYLPREAKYYDNSGKLYRRITGSNIKNMDGFPTLTQIKAENLNDKSYSITQMRNVKYNVNLPNSVFTEGALRMPPNQWLRK